MVKPRISRRAVLGGGVALAGQYLAGCGVAGGPDERFARSSFPSVARTSAGLEVSAHPARVRSEAERGVVVRASAPTWQLELTSPSGGTADLILENVPAQVRFSAPPAARVWLDATSLKARWELPPGESTIQVESGGEGPIRFAVISDLHRNLEVLGALAQELERRPVELVMCMGDLVNTGAAWELDEVLEALGRLPVPFYSTIGNHDLFGRQEAAVRFEERVGPTNLSFLHRGMRFIVVDSASAALPPRAYPWLEDQLSQGPSLVFTHIPPLDLSGFRNHAFKVREDAVHFLELLGRSEVAGLFVGHIHTFAQYELAGTPVCLSGGGGGIQERPGPGFHYLEVESSSSGALSVSTRSLG